MPYVSKVILVLLGFACVMVLDYFMVKLIVRFIRKITKDHPGNNRLRLHLLPGCSTFYEAGIKMQ